MEDDNTKEDNNEPTTSKEGSRSNNSEEDEYNDGKDDQVTNKGTDSDSYSMNSDINMARTGPVLPAASMMKDAKIHLKKKRPKRLTGRVKKRERPPAKRSRKPVKRKPKSKEQKKQRDLSVSTIFTRLSSSGYQTPGCEHCGHRCCRRRYEYERKKRWYYNRRNRRNIRKYNRNVKQKRMLHKRDRINMISENNQVGSRCNMLSKLFVATNSSPDENIQQSSMYCEVTPEMIYETLKWLTMWRQDVPFDLILGQISRRYPVNSDKNELMIELLDKLEIAALVGIVSRCANESWSIGHAFQKRRLERNHVTLFWKLYADTMTPIVKRQVIRRPNQIDGQTSTNAEKFIIYDEDFL